MKIAHLILTHKKPHQLKRLIKAMQHPCFDFYVHLDLKADINDYLMVAEMENVYFIKDRVVVNWPGWGIVQSTLNGLREIVEKNYTYINVISAQDFPLKPASYIYNYIVERKGTEFITCYSLKDQWKEAEPRVTRYFLTNYNIPWKRPIEKALSILPPRKFPLKLELVGRHNWFTVTRSAAKYIVDFMDEHPEMKRFFKFSWGADEIIFSTILYNSPFRNNIVNNLVYCDFTGRRDGHSNVLTRTDFDNMMNSGKLFARKFDVDVDHEIIRLLEEAIGIPEMSDSPGQVVQNQ